MKGFFEMEWKSEHHQPKEKFEFDRLEKIMGIKLPDDFKEFQYRNNNSYYPDPSNCKLYDENGDIAIHVPRQIETYLGIDEMINSLEIGRDDIGEIYYWHLPLTEIGPEKIILDYTHCKENPPVVWVDEEIGPYEDSLCYRPWKRYIAPTFKDFIEMIGDRNKPVGDWIDQDLMADGTRAGDE